MWISWRFRSNESRTGQTVREFSERRALKLSETGGQVVGSLTQWCGVVLKCLVWRRVTMLGCVHGRSLSIARLIALIGLLSSSSSSFSQLHLHSESVRKAQKTNPSIRTLLDEVVINLGSDIDGLRAPWFDVWEAVEVTVALFIRNGKGGRSKDYSL